MKPNYGVIGCSVLVVVVAVLIVFQEQRIRELEAQTIYLRTRLATVEKDAARQEKELTEKIKESGKAQLEWIIRHTPIVDHAKGNPQ